MAGLRGEGEVAVGQVRGEGAPGGGVGDAGDGAVAVGQQRVAALQRGGGGQRPDGGQLGRQLGLPAGELAFDGAVEPVAQQRQAVAVPL